MERYTKLSNRENEITEMIAWGATYKDVANLLFISVHTVTNIVHSVFEKTGVTKVNELSAWWFCTHFHISFDLSPLKRKIIATCLLALLIPETITVYQVFTKNRTKGETECRVSETKSNKEYNA